MIEGGDEGCGEGDNEGFGGDGEGGSVPTKCEEGGGVVGAGDASAATRAETRELCAVSREP